MKKVMICVVVFLALVLVAVSALAVFLTLQFRFPENTVICKTNVSHMFTWMAADRIQNDLDEYRFSLTLDGKQYTLTAQDLNLTLNEEKLEQLAESFEAGNTAVNTQDLLNLDFTAVEALLEQQIPENKVEPGTIELVWDEEAGAFALQSGADGEYNDRELALQAVTESIQRLDSALTLSEKDYRVTFRDTEKMAAAQEALEKANAYASCELTYIFYHRSGEEAPETIDSQLLGSWLVIGQDGLSVSLDQEKILKYASQMAATYSMGGEGYFMNHNGEEVNLPATVPENKVDSKALFQDIVKNLNSHVSGRMEVPYTVRNNYKNFDGTYIEISIIEQKLRAYLNGELFADTDVITGCAHCDHDSMTGVFEVQDHYRDIWLQESYFVNYWMGFWSPKYGMHDADGWRTEAEYGGDTYKTNGSGGCINVPRKVISEMFTAFENGVPVIIYDETYLLSAENAE